jgi:hypothetical protein
MRFDGFVLEKCHPIRQRRRRARLSFVDIRVTVAAPKLLSGVSMNNPPAAQIE